MAGAGVALALVGSPVGAVAVRAAPGGAGRGQGGWHADEVGVSDKALFTYAGAAQGVAPGQLELIDIIFNLIN